MGSLFRMYAACALMIGLASAGLTGCGDDSGRADSACAAVVEYNGKSYHGYHLNPKDPNKAAGKDVPNSPLHADWLEWIRP